MPIGELLSQIGVSPARIPAPRPETERAGARGQDTNLYGLSRARLEALLPESGIVVGPPEADDRLEISPLAHAILRAGVEMDGVESERVAQLRAAYVGGVWEPDTLRVASGLVASAVAERGMGLDE